MSGFRVGMKIYTMDWYFKFGMSYGEAAQRLKEQGVSFVLTQSAILPLPDSAVKSEVPSGMQERLEQYDDRAFRDALGEAGIEYYAAVSMFFDPLALEANPELRPIDECGEPMQKIDWYVGLCPSHEDFLKQRMASICNAVEILKPDGVFLAFIRFPGFWELWVRDASRSDFREYCFCKNCLERFQEERGVEIPRELEGEKAARWILANQRTSWTEWKCNVIAHAVGAVRKCVTDIRPDIRIMLNTVPFGRADYNNAIDEVFSQSVEKLSPVVDTFEVMTYHQILKRPLEWIPLIASEVKERTGREVLCTLQAKPLYLDGIHRPAGRRQELPIEEFAAGLAQVRASKADGVVVFIWSDFLQRITQGETGWLEEIRRIAAKPM